MITGELHKIWNFNQIFIKMGKITSNCTKALTFARVFTESESANAYQNMFAAVLSVFSVVNEYTNSDVFFFHIDGKGIICILADAHQVQVLGTV